MKNKSAIALIRIQSLGAGSVFSSRPIISRFTFPFQFIVQAVGLDTPFNLVFK